VLCSRFQTISHDNRFRSVFASLIDQTNGTCLQFEETCREFLTLDEELTGDASATTIRCSQNLEFFFNMKFQVKHLQSLVINLTKQVAALCNLDIFISTASKSINYLQFQVRNNQTEFHIMIGVWK
jgi:hypothetical protein